MRLVRKLAHIVVRKARNRDLRLVRQRCEPNLKQALVRKVHNRLRYINCKLLAHFGVVNAYFSDTYAYISINTNYYG